MEFVSLVRALRVRWWLPVGGLALGAAIAVGISLLLPPGYTASTELFVATTDTSSASEALQGGQFSQSRIASYTHILQGEDMASRVIRSLNLDMTAKQLQGEISVTPVTDTVLLDVAVTDRSPGRARDIAAALDDQFVSLVTDLETPDAGGATPVKVTVVQQPQLPRTASSPQLVRNIAIGMVAGLLLGAAGAILRARFDRSIKDRSEAAELAGAPVCGVVREDESLARRHVLDGAVASGAMEGYRQLRANIQSLDVDAPHGSS